jgi:hypothetical protein
MRLNRVGVHFTTNTFDHDGLPLEAGGDLMTEQRELVDGERMELAASITDRCATCPKKEFHTVAEYDPKSGIPIPMMMMGASPLDTVMFDRVIPRTEETTNVETGEVTTTTIEEHFLAFFRCVDPMCLLNHLRETMMFNWAQNEQIKRQKAMDGARMQALVNSKKRSKGKRANRRNKAKEKTMKSNG